MVKVNVRVSLDQLPHGLIQKGTIKNHSGRIYSDIKERRERGGYYDDRGLFWFDMHEQIINNPKWYSKVRKPKPYYRANEKW